MNANELASDNFLRLPEVKERTGIHSTSTVYHLIHTDGFPSPIRFGKRFSVWSEAEIEAYLHRKIYESRPESAS